MQPCTVHGSAAIHLMDCLKNYPSSGAESDGLLRVKNSSHRQPRCVEPRTELSKTCAVLRMAENSKFGIHPAIHLLHLRPLLLSFHRHQHPYLHRHHGRCVRAGSFGEDVPKLRWFVPVEARVEKRCRNGGRSNPSLSGQTVCRRLPTVVCVVGGLSFSEASISRRALCSSACSHRTSSTTAVRSCG